MPKILIFAAYFLPGFKGGGPIQSVKNILEALGSDFEFHVITYDRDLGDQTRYAGIAINEWTQLGKAKVWYLDQTASFTEQSKQVRRAVKEQTWQAVYLNSLFDPLFVLLPLMLRKLGILRADLTVVAPRGQLGPEALQFGRNKKQVYMAIVSGLRLLRSVRWQSTSDVEIDHFKAFFGPQRFNRLDVVSASNISASPSEFPFVKLLKPKGHAKFLFLARISPKKNLLGALEAIATLAASGIEFTVAGPEEDAEYTSLCREVASKMSDTIKVNFIGPVSRSEVPDLLASHHAFLFPTLGENFGHSIAEAILAGCVPIISDQTPWRNLSEKGAGWDVSLRDPTQLQNTVRSILEMDDEEYQKLRLSTRGYGEQQFLAQASIQETRALFTP